jgi:glutamate decarboxylase
MHKRVSKQSEQDDQLIPTYASRLLDTSLPKYKLPEDSVSPDVIYQVIKDELQLDGDAHMNLATFVTTWMEPMASKLMSESFEKNLVDRDEYPQTAEIEKRCVNILSELWNAPPDSSPFGTSTIGSSEACMLAGMAFRWNWRSRQESQGKQALKPNLVLGANAQICWEKFCRYWDVEPRFVPLENGRYHIDAKLAVEQCDENTIGVIGIMGSTLDGSYEPIQELNEQLNLLQDKTGLDIPIHVDAASGGFVAPFLQPDLIWDFRLQRVKSINASGHKYGMVYPGVGWILWRHPNDLPKELIFNVNYLGGNEPTFALNFSKPGNGVIAQYYNFLRLGRKGYTNILQKCQNTALYLSESIEKMEQFTIISSGSDIPVFSFTLNDDVTEFSLYDLSDSLRQQGWQVPAYTLPSNLNETVVMRIVVKENFSEDMAHLFISNFEEEVKKLVNKPETKTLNSRNSFHH